MQTHKRKIATRYVGYMLTDDADSLLKGLESLGDSSPPYLLKEHEESLYILVDPIKGKRWARELPFRNKKVPAIEFYKSNVVESANVHGNTFRHGCDINKFDRTYYFEFDMGARNKTFDCRVRLEYDSTVNPEKYYNLTISKINVFNEKFEKMFGEHTSIILQIILEYGFHKYFRDEIELIKFKKVCMNRLNITEDEFDSI